MAVAVTALCLLIILTASLSHSLVDVTTRDAEPRADTGAVDEKTAEGLQDGSPAAGTAVSDTELHVDNTTTGTEPSDTDNV